jgi:hypothetical protein
MEYEKYQNNPLTINLSKGKNLDDRLLAGYTHESKTLFTGLTFDQKVEKKKKLKNLHSFPDIFNSLFIEVGISCDISRIPSQISVPDFGLSLSLFIFHYYKLLMALS